MNYKLVNPNFKENYIEQLLKFKGIDNIDEYLNPTAAVLEDPELLDNIDEGAQLLLNVVKKEGRILLVVDSDTDGFTSSAIFYLYMKECFPYVNIEFILHEGKQHGLEDHIDSILNNNNSYDLIVLPDSSSNDKIYHDKLKEIGLPCLVLDHHLIDGEVSDNAIIINNQASKNYQNKDLTGVGVTWQFCRYLDRILDQNYSEKYIDLAALGIIGDMGSLLSLENRYIIKNGLENIENFFFKTLVEKNSYSMNNEITPIGIAFYVVPMINAMIRIGTINEKVRLFEAFIDGEKRVPSHKRGSNGELVPLAIESARECTNTKNKQKKIREEISEKLTYKIYKEDLLSNKILFIELTDEDDDFPPGLSGLIAMELASKFNKPTIVARLNDEGYVKGSIRGLNNSKLDSFKNFLESSNVMEFVSGHDNAAGCSIKESNIQELLDYSNEQLKDLNFDSSFYLVNFEREINDNDIIPLIKNIYKYHDLYGQDLSEPLIYIGNIFLKHNEVQIIGEKQDTIKFEKNGVTYIQFHAKKLINELSQYDTIDMEIIGRANINTWGGKETPQIFIDNYEVRDGLYSF